MKQKMLKGLISFFIVMFCCTIIARGAASVTTAKVSTSKLNSGRLVRSFQGTGEIQAGSKNSTSLPEGQKIAEILAEPGSAVETGQNLVRLDMAYLEEQITAQEREVKKLELSLEQQDLDGRTEARLPATAQAEITLGEAQRGLEEAEQTLAGEKQTLVEAQQALERALEEIADGSGETAGAEEEAVRIAEENLKAAQEAVVSAQNVLRQAQNSYALAEQEEANMQENESARAKSTELSKESTKLELEAVQEKLNKLYTVRETKGLITAQADGTLEAIGASVGSITLGTEQIVILTGGVEVCGILPEEAVGVVKAGDEMTVSVQGDTKSVLAVVERFGQDADGNTLWYGVPEKTEYRVGTILTYEYSQQSEKKYDQIIPLSALYESAGETYILGAEIRSGILGDDYTAVKIPVTVLEKDDVNAAVNTVISKETLFITGANKYVKEGDRIRLSE